VKSDDEGGQIKLELLLSALADLNNAILKDEADVCGVVAVDVQNGVSFVVSGSRRSNGIGRVCRVGRWVGGWAVLVLVLVFRSKECGVFGKERTVQKTRAIPFTERRDALSQRAKWDFVEEV
jgi:hypothetical protein